MKIAIAVLALSCSVALSSFGLSPTLVLGGFGGLGSYSLSPTPNTPYADAGINESFGWRQALPSGGYFSLASQGSFAPYVATLLGFLDNEALDAELGLPSGPNTMIFGAGVKSSFQNQSGNGTYALPYWSGEYRFARSSSGLQPSLTYGGRYVYQQFGGDNHFVEALGLKLDKSVSVRFDGYLGLSGAWELWPQQPILSSNGSATSSLRQDGVINLQAGARGLAGYTVVWGAGLSAGLRLSNANEYLSSTSRLVANSESRLTQQANASLTWSPTRSFSADISTQAQNDTYLARKALTTGGTPSSSNLDVVSVGGSAKASWTPNGKLYYVLRANASRTFANDPNFPQWSYDVSGGVEYSF